MKHKASHIIDDFSPRTRELARSRKPVAWGRNSLDRDRAMFTADEIEIARRIGSPNDRLTDEGRAD